MGSQVPTRNANTKNTHLEEAFVEDIRIGKIAYDAVSKTKITLIASLRR